MRQRVDADTASSHGGGRVKKRTRRGCGVLEREGIVCLVVLTTAVRFEGDW